MGSCEVGVQLGLISVQGSNECFETVFLALLNLNVNIHLVHLCLLLVYMRLLLRELSLVRIQL